MYDFTLKGSLNANIETVYKAFIDPVVISKWFAPSNLVVSQFLSNLVEGGRYQAVLLSPDGFQQTIVGTYQQIAHNKHLSFTWRWDDTNDISKVNIDFTQLPNLSTGIRLKQSGFAKEQEMIQQQIAWVDCLEKLSLTTRDISATHHGLVA